LSAALSDSYWAVPTEAYDAATTASMVAKSCEQRKNTNKKTSNQTTAATFAEEQQLGEQEDDADKDADTTVNEQLTSDWTNRKKETRTKNKSNQYFPVEQHLEQVGDQVDGDEVDEMMTSDWTSIVAVRVYLVSRRSRRLVVADAGEHLHRALLLWQRQHLGDDHPEATTGSAGCFHRLDLSAGNGGGGRLTILLLLQLDGHHQAPATVGHVRSGAAIAGWWSFYE
jgi:hypothetical protein